MDRLATAAVVLAAVEAACAVLPTPRRGRYRSRGRVARRAGGPPLPLPVEPQSGPESESVLACAADEVRVGKTARPEQLRVRGFYPDGLTVKVVSSDRLRGRLRKEADVRRRLETRLPGLAPELVDSGEVGGLGWIVERSVQGSHPRTPQQRDAVARALLPALVALNGVDRQPVRVDQALDWSDVSRLRAWTGGDPDTATAMARLARVAHAVLTRHPRALVSCGLSHGDVVASNVVVHDDGRVGLLDWEFVGRRTFGFDLVKLLADVDDSRDHVARVAPLFDAGRPPGALPAQAQMAVAGLRAAASYAEAARRASAVGRERTASSLIPRRVQLVQRVVCCSGLVT